MNEQLIKSDGREICTDGFGKQTNPAILLIMGLNPHWSGGSKNFVSV
ncbi:hypothetical protein GMA19_02287 [Paenibacillus polymyxa E681]|nr:hypothetical protein GE561_02287 [Paenibacillus polymyxa E681]QNV61957.1 hypothetical protein GMA19_02287 [Paenibacillus polymyxa E681]